jgi:hypothetical protein
MSLDISTAMAEGAGVPRDDAGGSDSDPTTPPPDTAKDFTGKGELLEEPDGKRVAKRVEKLWKGQNPTMRPREQQWRANEYVMSGIAGVRLVKDTDTDTFVVHVPFGASAVRVGIPKTKELADKVTATLFVDPPAPDAQPSPDDQGDLAKADLATRILKNECTEAGLDLHAKLRSASALGATYGSGFLVIDVDPTGGGWEPLAIDAHPAATHYDPQQPDVVLADPTGMELGPQPPVRKYLAEVPKPEPSPDGTEAPPVDENAPIPLTDDPAQAQRRWQLKLRGSVITGRQLRFLPMLARGIDDADGVIIADVTTFGALRGMFKEINSWPKERQVRCMTWRPVPLKDILPPGVVVEGNGEAYVEGPDDPRQGLPADEALCAFLRVIYKATPAYPDGAEVLCAGETALHRDTRCVWVGEGQEKRPECLDINVVQVLRHEDESGANPYGIGDAQLLGPGDDLRGQLLVAATEALFKSNNRNVFVPLGSVVDPGVLENRDGTPIPYNPQAGVPLWEEMPGMDPSTLPLYQMIGREQDGRSGLEDAQQLNNPSITSGKQANAIVEQSLTILSPLNAHAKKAAARAFRITLQQFRAFATQPMLLRYTGEDGRYLVKEFTNTDLGSSRDVRIAAGTSTMLSQSAKMQLAQQDLEIGLKAGDTEGAYRRYRQAMASNLDPQLGRDQDPAHHRVLRQIHAWREFAKSPEAQQPPPASPPPPPQVDPMSGAVVQPPPVDPTQTPDPRALDLFRPVPADAQPDVARTRTFALADEQGRESYDRAPRWVQLALDAAYDKARKDAGIVFAAEQAQMAAQQQQAQAAAQQQGEQLRAQTSRETTDRTLSAKAQEGEANRAAALERTHVQTAARNGAMAGAA